jgi:hypothetical protein
MTTGAWFAAFVIATLISLPLGEYFIGRLRKEAPNEHQWAGSPKPGSIIWRGPPHLGYVSFILSRRYVTTLSALPRMRLMAEVLFWLHGIQILSLIVGAFSHLSHGI